MTATNTKLNSSKEIVKSITWLIEAAFRSFAGYMLVLHFRHEYVAVAAGVYALATSALIVIAHFVKAHR